MINEHTEFSSSTSLKNQPIFIRPLAEGTFHDSIATKLNLYKKAIEPDTHFGIGGFRNLDVAVAVRSKRLVLADINPKQIAFWKLFDEIITVSNTAQDFIEKLASNMFRLDYQYFSLTGITVFALPIKKEDIDRNKRNELDILEKDIAQDSIDDISFETAGIPYFWLESTTNFQWIKSLFISGNVDLISIDFQDTENFKKLNQWLLENNINISSIYTSNLVYYFSSWEYDYFDHSEKSTANDKMEKFGQNLLALSPSSDALHIYTDYSSHQKKFQTRFFDVRREEEIKRTPLNHVEQVRETMARLTTLCQVQKTKMPSPFSITKEICQPDHIESDHQKKDSFSSSSYKPPISYTHFKDVKPYSTHVSLLNYNPRRAIAKKDYMDENTAEESNRLD
ncbi:TPA: hypothetical protein ACTXXA_000408 [Legionella anisa]